MNEPKQYTQEEVEGNIRRLTGIMNTKKKERTGLSKEINNLKKQIEYWESIYKRQTKLF